MTTDAQRNYLHLFKNKNVLLLQGPVGPFFWRFSREISDLGACVYKINFNAGDEFFYRKGTRFSGNISKLYEFLLDFIKTHEIDSVVMFGDCRPIHIEAKKVANDVGADVYVFEEGYLRPNHITLEPQGINGHSSLSKDSRDYLFSHLDQDIQPPAVVAIGKTFWYAAAWAILYYVAASIGRHYYPHYQHHRPLSITEAWPWVRGTARKWWFKFKERGLQKKLTTKWSNRYFLVPLQVYNDFQILQHSPYQSIETFIEEVIRSFATHAPQETLLVLKQHPFDRGYQEYSQLIARLAKELNVVERVVYIHDQYLPALITHAQGVIVVNSTVGLSAVSELRPVKVCGEAIYDLPYLTVQAPLDAFWHLAPSATPDATHVHQYMFYLTKHTQHNGSFYRRIPNSGQHCGVIWD